MDAMKYTAEAEWMSRFLRRLHQLNRGEGVLGAISFALKQFKANSQRSPEEVAEVFAREHSL